ncbi:outer membrane protein assembly factor BamB family protein [Aurantivibrio infirmus]
MRLAKLSISLISLILMAACSDNSATDEEQTPQSSDPQETTTTSVLSSHPLVQLPGKNWITNGGNIYNQRYSPLTEINTENVKNLKGEWLTHLDGSGVGPPYSGEAQPIVEDGIIYIPTGADDVFALSAETGEKLWVYKSGLDSAINTVCCGWSSRGVGLSEDKIFLGQLDGKLVALDKKTGDVVWSIQAENWQEGYTITSAALYYDGMVITGFSGAEFATRGRVKAYDADDGKLLWTFYTVPGPGEFGHDTWPQDSDAYKHGGGTVWQTPAVDPDLGLIYFSTGNPGPDLLGAVRPGDNLFTSSIVALDVKTGKYRWHFQQVHHDLWDFDSPSPVVLFDIEYKGEMRKALAEVSKTGWAYILDRTNGEPLIGIEEKPVPQEPRQMTSPTQPFPIGDPVIPHHIDIAPAGYELINEGRIFTPFWEDPVVSKPNGLGGTNWPPSSYDPKRGHLYICSNDRMGFFTANGEQEEPTAGKHYMGGRFGSTQIPLNGIFASFDMRTNKMVWSQRWKDSCWSGSINTAGDLVFVGRNEGQLQALDSRDGKILWEFQTGAGVNATATTFEHKGKQKVVVYAAGNLFAGSKGGDNVWLFSLDGTLESLDQNQGSARFSFDDANPEAGALVFEQSCSQCHGETGQGGHGVGPDITAVVSPVYVATTATDGKEKMPPFGAVLSSEQIRDVAVFVATKLGKE